MAETLTLELRLTADGSGIVGEVRGATDALQRLARGENQAGDEARKLARDTDRVAQRQQRATRSTTNLNRAMGSFTRTLVTTAAAYLSLRTASDLVDSYRQQEQAVASLDAALASMGRTSTGLSSELQALASQIQGEGIIGDEAIIKGQAFLATYADIADDVLPRATRVMADIAAKMGGDVTSAANLVGKAAMGMTGELARTGITLSDTAKKSKDFELILSEIESQVGGTNAALGDTATGGLTQFSNALGDVREQLGEAIAEATSPWLRELAKDLALSQDEVDDWRESFDGAFEFILRAAGVVRDAFFGFQLVFKLGRLAFEGMKLAILEGLHELLTPARAILEQLDKVPDVLLKLSPAGMLLKRTAEALASLDGGATAAWAADTSDAVRQLTDDVVNMLSITEAPSAAWQRRLDEIRERVNRMREASDGAAAAAGGFARQVADAADNTRQLAAEASATARILDELFPAEAAFREHLERLDLLERAHQRGTISAQKYAAALAAENDRYLELSMATDDVSVKTERLARETKQTSDAQQRADSVARDLGLTFSSAFEDAIVKGKGFREVLQGIAEDVARIIARKTITEPLGNALGDLLGGFDFGDIFSPSTPPIVPAAAPGAVTPSMGAVFLHAGGEVGRDGQVRQVPAALFAHARRMHAGGLAGDEVPAILQRGERVLPRGENAGVTVNYAPVINAIDTRTGAEFLAAHRNVVVGLVNDAFNRRGVRGPVR